MIATAWDGRHALVTVVIPAYNHEEYVSYSLICVAGLCTRSVV